MRADDRHSRRGIGSGQWPALLALIVVGLFATVCLAALAPQSASADESPLNKTAPQFVRKTLDGGKLDLGNFRGKVVLLDFWATWCASCQIELPAFARWQRSYGAQGLQVIGISMDDDPELARRFYRRLKLSYPVAMGDEQLGAQYGGVLGLPLTFLIDRHGVVRARFQGETDLKLIDARLKELLAEP